MSELEAHVEARSRSVDCLVSGPDLSTNAHTSTTELKASSGHSCIMFTFQTVWPAAVQSVHSLLGSKGHGLRCQGMQILSPNLKAHTRYK